MRMKGRARRRWRPRRSRSRERKGRRVAAGYEGRRRRPWPGRRRSAVPGRNPVACSLLTLRFAVRDDLAVEHAHLTPQTAGQLTVVGDHHDRRAIGVELLEQLEDGGAGGAVDVACGFIGEDDGGPAHERSRYRHPLALTARHRGGPQTGTVLEPDTGQCLIRQQPTLAYADSGVEQAIGDV